ncbi:MAG: GDSL-type esterase/lipase family protein [Pirellulaceae bacterium]
MERHIVLLGDSVFDNAAYVPGEHSVIDHLRAISPREWSVTLLAVDGDVTDDVVQQLELLPADATDLVVSVGGNDALQHAGLLEQANSVEDLAELLAEVLPQFRERYATMLDAVEGTGRAVVVCTVYDQCPFPNSEWRELVPLALAGFNECILEEAEGRAMASIDLCEICTDPEDYSSLSPIEPSSIGGSKIAAVILRTLSEWR